MTLVCEICGKTFSRRAKPAGAHTYCSYACSGKGKQKRRTVYDNTTGELVIAGGTAEECAEAMGISVDSFKTAVWLVRKGKNKRWTIIENQEEE